MPAPLLTVEHLTIRHGERVIVQDLSFAIHRGEIVALTGLSGSGKTSIAAAILDTLPSGLDASGHMQWDGSLVWRDSDRPWESLRGTEISFIPQDVYGTFDPIMRIGKQMTTVVHDRKAAAKEDIEKQLKQAMLDVGLQDIERLWISYPHQLSGGQLQRCQICIAIALQPKLLIADEPTSALDKVSQKDLLDVFAMLRRTYQMAILCITHESAVVQYLSDREIRLSPVGTRRADAILHQLTSADEVIARVANLIFTHRYGGLFGKEGAQIGPVHFELRSQSCLGIMGASGSGKSTIAQLLVGLLTPSHGSIQMHDETIDLTVAGAIEQLRWKVQLVMQDGRGSLHPNFTIHEILQEVVVNRSRHGRPSRAVEDVLAEVHLSQSLLQSQPGQLSGGECVRVSLARALLMEPGILICDESTAALDEETRDSILSLLQALMRSRRLAIIFISHDSQLMAMMADQVLVMDEGKMVEFGSVNDILYHPKHEKTRKMVAANATLAAKMTPW